MTDQRSDSSFVITVKDADASRIDKYISENLELFSRSQIKNRNVRVLLNKQKVKLSKKVSDGDLLEIYYTSPTPLNIKPEKVSLDIIFENKDVIVLNKPQGLVVHPAPGNYHGTMVQGLMYYLGNLEEQFPEENLRPGIVHRLDKDTSGIIIAAKNPTALEFLSNQFREKTTRKNYIAFVKGRIVKRSGTVESFIIRDRKNRKKFTVSNSAGKKAVTDYRVVKSNESASFLVLTPHTGRTHQLRVHMLSIGHAIIGDPVYGRKSKVFGDLPLMLHALQLKIILPGENKPRIFSTSIPERFVDFMNNNRGFEELSEELLQEYL